MARVKSWWRLKKVCHRDAVVLSVVSSAMLIASQLPFQEKVYEQYLAGVTTEPLLFLFTVGLLLLAYTSYFAGILVLEGGVNFLWGRASRGRFMISLGVGLSLLGLLKVLALAVLVSGSPLVVLVYYTTTLQGLGLITGFASYALMHEYALMLKRHARDKWREWRRVPRPTPNRRRSRTAATTRY